MKPILAAAIVFLAAVAQAVTITVDFGQNPNDDRFFSLFLASHDGVGGHPPVAWFINDIAAGESGLSNFGNAVIGVTGPNSPFVFGVNTVHAVYDGQTIVGNSFTITVPTTVPEAGATLPLLLLGLGCIAYWKKTSKVMS